MTLGILAHDVVELYEHRPAEDDDAFWNSDGELAEEPKRNRTEGRAFHGTLLGGSVAPKKPAEPAQVQTQAVEPIKEAPAVVVPIVPVAPVVAAPATEASAEHQIIEMDSMDVDDTIACPQCTFCNPVGVSCCTMCEGSFDMAL